MNVTKIKLTYQKTHKNCEDNHKNSFLYNKTKQRLKYTSQNFEQFILTILSKSGSSLLF